jgi:hypothetical protein
MVGSRFHPISRNTGTVWGPRRLNLAWSIFLSGQFHELSLSDYTQIPVLSRPNIEPFRLFQSSDSPVLLPIPHFLEPPGLA